jgi:1,2-dihydroxy-3-keto-5-methylthiopentene dioxygenase
MTLTATTTRLRVYDESDASKTLLETTDGDEIARSLQAIGVRFERWAADAELPPGASHDAVIAAYQRSVDRLKAECGYRAVDVIRLERGTPDTEPMRMKFLNEHQHSEDEVRFFVEGRGAFYLRAGGNVFQTICVRGDLISVPAGTKHWFDMGADPQFTAIRLFTNADGWVAQFTGDPIAERFPRLDA